MLGIISLLLIALSITIFIKLHQDQIPITFSSDNPEGTRSGAYADQDEMILVDIEGGVVRPGVYRLPQNSRIDDVLGFAGGFTDQADMEAVARSINRAAKLSDGAKIYVPIKNMTTEDNRPGVEGITMININTASRTELEDIPGIGPVTADKIISARPFTRLEELVERNVLSISLYDKVKNLLTL
jgi:competence protein ComEA